MFFNWMFRMIKRYLSMHLIKETLGWKKGSKKTGGVDKSSD